MKMIKRLAKQLVFACTLCIVSTVFAQDSRYFLHTVTKGQGLYSISRMYNVTEDEIIQLNPGSEKVIKVAEEIYATCVAVFDGERSGAIAGICAGVLAEAFGSGVPEYVAQSGADEAKEKEAEAK